MRVLIVASAYPRSPTDVITPWLGETIRQLGIAGVDAEVLAPSYRGLGDQEIDGVAVRRFRYAPRAWERLTHEQTAPDRIRERPAYLSLVPGYVGAGALAAARLARTGRFDVVHVLWPLPHGLLGLAAKRAGGVPLVCTFFGAELRWLAARPGPMRTMLRAIVAGSDAVTAISASTAAALAACVPGVQVTTIPFGAAVAAPDVVGHPRAARRAGDPFALLFVGRLVERKGVHVLLDAMASSGDAVRLDVVGDGPERAALEARARSSGIAHRVRFHGLVPADALASHFDACDALVLPAIVDAKGDTEGLGVVLIEALSRGRPVIASAVGGIPDVVRDGETGLLVPPGDAPALARAIDALASDPARAQALAEAGQRHVEREFSWPTIVERLTAVYASAARRRRAGAA